MAVPHPLSRYVQNIYLDGKLQTGVFAFDRGEGWVRIYTYAPELAAEDDPFKETTLHGVVTVEWHEGAQEAWDDINTPEDNAGGAA
jgi:hypothetical protein